MIQPHKGRTDNVECIFIYGNGIIPLNVVCHIMHVMRGSGMPYRLRVYVKFVVDLTNGIIFSEVNFKLNPFITLDFWVEEGSFIYQTYRPRRIKREPRYPGIGADNLTHHPSQRVSRQKVRLYPVCGFLSNPTNLPDPAPTITLVHLAKQTGQVLSQHLTRVQHAEILENSPGCFCAAYREYTFFGIARDTRKLVNCVLHFVS